MYRCPLPYIAWERRRWRRLGSDRAFVGASLLGSNAVVMRLTLGPTPHESFSQEYFNHFLDYISFARYSTDGYMTPSSLLIYTDDRSFCLALNERILLQPASRFLAGDIHSILSLASSVFWLHIADSLERILNQLLIYDIRERSLTGTLPLKTDLALSEKLWPPCVPVESPVTASGIVLSVEAILIVLECLCAVI